MHDTDPLFEALRKLPVHELEARQAEAVLRGAQRVLAMRDARAVPKGWPALLQALWSRFVAPAVVTVTVATYLVWAVNAAGALYR